MMINLGCDYCEEARDSIKISIISKRVQPGLKDCSFNKLCLCTNCYKELKENMSMQLLFKRTLQEQLFSILKDEYLTIGDISKLLYIKAKDVHKIVKLIHPVEGYKYHKADVVRACMGGKLIMEELQWD